MKTKAAGKNKIEKKIKDIIAHYFQISADKIKTTDTIASLGGDSLELVEIVLEIESEFAFLISDEEAYKFKNIGDLIKHVKENL